MSSPADALHDVLLHVWQDLSPVGCGTLRIVRDEAGAPLDLEWLYQNRAAARINRLPHGTGCAGKRLLQEFPAMRDTAIWEACCRLATSGEVWSGETFYEGEHFASWFRVTALPAGAEVIALFFDDITDMKRSAQAREEEATTNETLLRVANSLTDLDLDRVVQRVTDEATRICRAQFGAFFYNVSNAEGESYMLYTLSGVHRSAFQSFPMPRNTEVFAPTFMGQGVVRSDDITKDERYGKNPPFYGMPKGHLPVRSYLAVPVVSRSSEVLGGLFFGHEACGVFTDRDERLLVAIAQQAAVAMDNARLFEIASNERRRAEEANRAKDEFLATVSHELRTPLHAMLGWSRMLRSGALAEDKREHAIEVIERNAKSQVALIEDVLDVSRIITGKLRLSIETVDLGRVLEAALDSIRPAATAKGVRLQTLLDPDAGVLMGDPNRLQQVLWNLLSNAVKFTPKGGRVHVSVQREDSHLKLVVADSGYGIAPEFLPYVFDRFRQADSTMARAHGGLGLGLAIVKHLTELHGGTVTAESAGRDQGTTFTVRLPLAPLTAAAPPESSRCAANSRDVSPLECPPGIEGLHILLVDDERDARELLRTLLEHCNATVTLAASSEEAFQALSAEPPDVLVSDIGMPGEDGYALIRRVRALPPERGGRTPAIALTAYARSEDRTRVLARGYNHHVPKPVDPAELLVTIANLAGRFEAR